jgi:hypothetical protein
MLKSGRPRVSNNKRYVPYIAIAIVVLTFGSYIQSKTFPVEDRPDTGEGPALLVTDVIPLDRPDYEQYGQRLFNVYITNVGGATAVAVRNQYAFADNAGYLDEDATDKLFHEIHSALKARRNEVSSDEIPKNASRHFAVVANKFEFDYAVSGKNVLYLFIELEYRDKTLQPQWKGTESCTYFTKGKVANKCFWHNHVATIVKKAAPP